MTLNILDWTEAYLRYRDAVHRKVKELKKDEEKKQILCELKNGSNQAYLCLDDLSSVKIKELNNVKVSCLNNKKNFDWLISNWTEIKNKDVSFLFANPSKAAHWSINPKTHHSVSDKSALRQGLKALFESVPEVQ